MPANPKYLTTSGWQRFAKITAGIVGGYLVSVTLHLAFAAWVDHVNVLITITFSGFLIWAILLIYAFLFRNGWRAWLLYFCLTLVFTGIAVLGIYYNPHFMQ